MDTTLDDQRKQAVMDLASLVVVAKRCQRIVHRFEEDALTEWDRAHLAINARLDDLIGR